jgi:hypothetical protein
MYKYKKPKIGLFNIHVNEYQDGGWASEVKECVIIGEDFDCYIKRFITTKTGYWTEEGRWTEWCTIGVGVHKSRFIDWKQKELF